MLLSLLGVCVLVGPFQGPEWEPVRGLLTDQDHSCRHPQCCGNLLVFCLFIIWQVQHCWRWFTRSRSSRKEASKVSPRKWTVASRRPDTHFRLGPAIHFSPRKLHELEAHIQQWAQKKQGRHQKQLWESWPLYLLPWPSSCREALTSVATSFPGISTLPPDSVWESWQVPWVFSDDEIYKSLPPAAMEMYGRMEHLLFDAQEELVSLEPVVNVRSDTPSVSLATALPLPQRLHICSQEFLRAPSSQPGAASSRELDRASGKKRQTVGREGGQRAQARGDLKEAKSSRKNAKEAPAPGRRRPMGFRWEDQADGHGLGGRSQTPGLTQKRVAAENRVAVEELGDSGQRESGHKTPGTQEAGVQAHRGEDQERVRGETAETLTLGRAVQDESEDNGVAEAPEVEENRRAPGGESRGMGVQDQAGGEPRGGTQAQIPGNSSTEILAGEGRSQEQAGREKPQETPVSAGEGLGDVKQDCAETHSPAGGAERAGPRQTSRAEIWKQLNRELQMWGGHHLRRPEGSRKKRLREVRQEDWVVMQALWRADVMPAVCTAAGELGLAEGEHRGLAEGEHHSLAEGEHCGLMEGEHYSLVEGEHHGLVEREHRGLMKGEHYSLVEGEHRGLMEGERYSLVEGEHRGLMEGEHHGLVEREHCGLMEGEHHGPTVAQHRAELQTAEWRGQSTAEGALTVGMESGAPGPSRGSAGRTIWEQLGLSSTGVEDPGEPSPREAKRANGGESQAPREEEQAQPGSGLSGKTHWARWEPQGRIREEGGTQAPGAGNGEESPNKAAGETHASGERDAGRESIELPAPENQAEDGEEGNPSPAGTEAEAPGQRHESKAGGEGSVGETQSSKRGHPGPLGGDSAESHAPGGQDGDQEGAGNEAEKQRNCLSVAGMDAVGFGELQAEHPTQLRVEWPAQCEMGGEQGIDIQGESSPGDPSGDTETQTQAPQGVFGEESRSETDGEMRVPGQGAQSLAEILAAGGQKVAGSRGEDKAQSGHVDTPRTCPHLEPSAGEGAPALAGSHGAAPGEEESEASARRLASKPLQEPGELLARVEGACLAGQPVTPDGRHEKTMAPLKAQRHPRKNKAAGGGNALGPTSQLHPDPPAPDAHSVLPPRPWRRAPKAAPAAGAPRNPKQLVLKRSQQLLLESLLHRKSAHLRWGLPQRVLESHLLSPSGPCAPPLAPTVRPGFHGGCRQPEPLERPGEAPEFPERARPLERKSWQRPPQGNGLEKGGPPRRSAEDRPPRPERPRGVRPAGGLREPQQVREAAGSRTQFPGSRPGPEEAAPGPCPEEGSSRNMGRPGASQGPPRAPGRAGATHSSSGPGPQDAPEAPRNQHQVPTLQRRGSLEPAEKRLPGSRPSSQVPGAASFKGSLQGTAARLGTALWNRITSSPHLARRQPWAPTLRHPDPSVPSKLGPPPSREDCIRLLQRPDGHCAGLAPPNTDVPQKPKGVPPALAASPKSGLMKHLRYFLLQRVLRK